jgi:hypothetical protein
MFARRYILVFPRAYSDRARKTISSVSFALACLVPCKLLPLECRSALLSTKVPSQIWRGFTHVGLSQRWSPQGVGQCPYFNLNASRCAPTVILPMLRGRNRPYPSLSIWNGHKMQSSELQVLIASTSHSYLLFFRLKSPPEPIRPCWPKNIPVQVFGKFDTCIYGFVLG